MSRLDLLFGITAAAPLCSISLEMADEITREAIMVCPRAVASRYHMARGLL